MGVYNTTPWKDIRGYKGLRADAGGCRSFKLIEVALTFVVADDLVAYDTRVSEN